MYGGSESIAYFYQEKHEKLHGSHRFQFNWQNVKVLLILGKIGRFQSLRSGDYKILGTWLHVGLPAVSVAGYNGRSVCISWTPNFMHALIRSCTISFNDLCAAKFDGTHLDFLGSIYCSDEQIRRI